MDLRQVFTRVLTGLIILVGASYAWMMLLRFLPVNYGAWDLREIMRIIVILVLFAAAGVSLLYASHSSRYGRFVRSTMWAYLVILAVFGVVFGFGFVVAVLGVSVPQPFVGSLIFLMGVVTSLIGLGCLLGYALFFVRFAGGRLERMLEAVFLVLVGIASLRIILRITSSTTDLFRIFVSIAVYSLIVGLLIWVVRIRSDVRD